MSIAHSLHSFPQHLLETWFTFEQAAADELELGSRLWAEGCASAAGAPAELLSGDGWRRYVTALGHVHLVALVLKQAAASAAMAEECSSEADRLMKGWQRCLGQWQLSVPGALLPLVLPRCLPPCTSTQVTGYAGCRDINLALLS